MIDTGNSIEIKSKVHLQYSTPINNINIGGNVYTTYHTRQIVGHIDHIVTEDTQTINDWILEHDKNRTDLVKMDMICHDADDGAYILKGAFITEHSRDIGSDGIKTQIKFSADLATSFPELTTIKLLEKRLAEGWDADGLYNICAVEDLPHVM